MYEEVLSLGMQGTESDGSHPHVLWGHRNVTREWSLSAELLAQQPLWGQSWCERIDPHSSHLPCTFFFFPVACYLSFMYVLHLFCLLKKPKMYYRLETLSRKVIVRNM